MSNRTLAIAIALALASHGAGATADGCATILRTPDGFLNLRAAPMMGSKVVARLKPGDRLSISSATCETRGSLSICNEDGWTRVDGVGDNPRRGWVATRFLKFIECDQ
jgi:hypothetical protein